MQTSQLQLQAAQIVDWDNRPAINAMLESLDNNAKLEHLQRGLSEHPENAFLHGHLGKVWLAMNEPDLALKHLTIAIKAEHDNASLLFNLGLAYLHINNKSAALSWIKDAVEAGGNADHTLLLIKTCLELEAFSTAVDACKRGMQKHPHDIRFKFAYANTLNHTGETERALQWLTLNDSANESELAWLRYQFSNKLGKTDISKRALDEYHLRLLQSQPDYRERALRTLHALPDSHTQQALVKQWKQTLQPLLAMHKQSLPRVAMSILVRDEADIIEHNIRYHAAAGVEHFAVTDNGSVDGTRDILQQLQSEFSMEIIDEPSFTIDQDLWVTRMAKRITDTNQYDWIIHNDADEFWVPSAGYTLPQAVQHCLSQSPHEQQDVGILNCKRFNMLTCKELMQQTDYQFYLNTFSVLIDVPLCAGEEKWNNTNSNAVARQVMDKVLTRTVGLGNVEYGNHGASHELQQCECNSVRILHYPIRSYDQFERKVINYGSSLEKNTRFKEGSSAHLRYWYKRHQQGKLEQDYDKITFANVHLQALEKSGHVIQDETLFDFFDTRFCVANRNTA